MDDGINEILGEGFCSLDLSLENHYQIDNEIFLCENCGWWYDIIEESESESGVCESCYEE